MTLKYAALLPLRGGSKSIPQKNIKSFCGRPLCEWVLRAASRVPAIESIWVSTDSDRIEQVVRDVAPHVRVHRRPEMLGGDLTSTEAVVADWLERCRIENPFVITLQATSPQTTSEHLVAALDHFEAERADSLVTGVRTHRFFWRDDGRPLNYDPAARPMRQSWSGTFMENGAFYVSTRERLLAGAARLHGKISLYEMDASCAIELDDSDDWVRLESQFEKRNCS